MVIQQLRIVLNLILVSTKLSKYKQAVNHSTASYSILLK